jgi:phage nucleotide-binding protein
MLIKNTSNVTNQKLKLFIYGESGAGKTTLASTVPVKTLVISAESGLLSLKGKNIDYVDITVDSDGKSIPLAMRWKRLGEVLEHLTTQDNDYECIYLDSLTEMGQCLIEYLKTKYTDAKDTIKMYGENSDRMKSMIKAFRDLPGKHVVMVALSKIDKDENGKRFFGVDLIGKAADQCAAFFDEVFFLGVTEDKKRVLVTNKTEKVIAKDRSGRLSEVEPADLNVVFGKILN